MEHKLVELARDLMAKSRNSIILKKQIHREESGTDRSGMICSGEQTVCLCPVSAQSLPDIRLLNNKRHSGKEMFLSLSAKGLQIIRDSKTVHNFHFSFTEAEDWKYLEKIHQKWLVHIIGGGHVGWATSRLMKDLGFYVILYDERKDLNTMSSNTAANEKHIIPYDTLSNHINSDPQAYVLIMTFGYRSDKVVLKNLINKDFRYIAMMGSRHKTEVLWNELKLEGEDPDRLEKVKAPAGLQISSQSPMEIAVSIAAEIIRDKNKS